MDGTLLQNGSMQVSDHTIQLIDQLKKKDYLFVAASGRQYSNLKRQFKDQAKDMAFICENGAVVVYQEEFLFISPMEHTLAMELCHNIYQREGCEVLISGKDVSYLKAKDSSFLHRMQDIVKNNVIVIDNFEDIKEAIVKISVYEAAGIVEHSASYFLEKWEERVKCTVSGFGWLDFVNPNVNKGASLQELMNKLGVAKEDTYAFGDNYNDIEMLQTVEHGYVMDNAVDDIKKQFKLSCRSVEEELEKLI